jgi:hypothetical protein
MNDLTRAFTRAVRRRSRPVTLSGLIGDKNDDGTYTIQVNGQPGFVYVRARYDDGAGGVVVAYNGKVEARPDLPVLMTMNETGVLTIVGVDYAQLDNYYEGGAAESTGVGPHHHNLGSGLEDLVEGLRFMPGLVHCHKVAGVFGLLVYIEPFAYEYGGVLKYWPGGSLDLTSYRPATASKQAWVIIGVNPVTNAAAAKTGSEYALAVPLRPADTSGIDFSGRIPLAGIKLKNGQTTINNFANFCDLRLYASGGPSVGKRRGVLTKTANYTATSADDVIIVDAASGNVTITLPAAASSTGLELTIKRIDASGNTMTIDGNASETIDDSTTQALSQYDVLTMVCDGAEWWITGN